MTNKSAPSYLLQGKNIILVFDNKSHTISRDTHMSYSKIVDAIKDQDWELVRNLVEPKKAIIDFGKGNVTIKGNTVYWKGIEFHNSLSSKMIEMYNEGFPVDPLIRFMENLMENPSSRAVKELYGFLEKGQLPITPDGHFLAYKKVNSNFRDVHSGSVLNKPAYMLTEDELDAMPMAGGRLKEVTVDIEDGVTVVSMPRNMVNEDRDQTCSEGLHFCSQEYLGHFGGSEVVILKINPCDVVSIPSDYNDTKGRCSRYQIVGVVDGPVESAFAAVVEDRFEKKPIAAWPFPIETDKTDKTDIDDDGDDSDFDDDGDDSDFDFDDDGDFGQLYDLVRRYNPLQVEHRGVTKERAEMLRQKNIDQKKAQLMIVRTGTQIPVSF
jgi:hypothetical protein